MKFAALGESAVLIETGLMPDLAAPMVRQWVRSLESRALSGVVEVVPSFTTVAVFYDAAQVAREYDAPPYTTICNWIERRLTRLTASDAVEPRQFIVPVCYGAEFGPDLEEVARATKLTTDAVVRLHSKAVYEVRAIGFSPGFPYLAGLPEELHVPRRPTPRIKIPAGSVGIGGAQTGVYSLVTPGGWNLIGRTPWVLFDATMEPPCLFRIGDRVQFDPIGVDAMAGLGAGPLRADRNTTNRDTE